jgi:hypothetical protein
MLPPAPEEPVLTPRHLRWLADGALEAIDLGADPGRFGLAPLTAHFRYRLHKVLEGRLKVSSTDELAAALAEQTDRSLAYEVRRVTLLARLGFAVGWLSADAALAAIAPLAERVEKEFHGFKALAAEQVKQPLPWQKISELRQWAKELCDDPGSPWKRLTWEGEAPRVSGPWLALKLRISRRCPGCLGLMPVNSLDGALRCGACGEEGQAMQAALDRVMPTLVFEGSALAIGARCRHTDMHLQGTFAVEIERVVAGCLACGAPFADELMESVAPLEHLDRVDARVSCPACSWIHIGRASPKLTEWDPSLRAFLFVFASCW